MGQVTLSSSQLNQTQTVMAIPFPLPVFGFKVGCASNLATKKLGALLWKCSYT